MGDKWDTWTQPKDIQNPTVATVQQSAPVIRVRINLSSTVKEGYRLGEATVEWTGSPDPDWDVISAALRQATVLGQEHANALNNGEDLV